jgi:hypothetical protein
LDASFFVQKRCDLQSQKSDATKNGHILCQNGSRLILSNIFGISIDFKRPVFCIEEKKTNVKAEIPTGQKIYETF